MKNKKKKPAPEKKKFYTPAEANKTLPLVRAIVQDIVNLAGELRDKYEKIQRYGSPENGNMPSAYQEEARQLQEDFDSSQERMREYVEELTKLGIELKDHDKGLIDFRAMLNGREVYLCWLLGESEVGHWHELDTGFAGRKKIRKVGTGT